jgi:hypothetical protein
VLLGVGVAALEDSPACTACRRASAARVAPVIRADEAGEETQEKAWTPFVSNAGQRLPYRLG